MSRAEITPNYREASEVVGAGQPWELPFHKALANVIAQKGLGRAEVSLGERSDSTIMRDIRTFSLKGEQAAISSVRPLYEKVMEEPEFRVLMGIYRRTEFAVVPGKDKLGREISDQWGIDDYNPLMALIQECSWDESTKIRAVAKFWETQASNWQQKRRGDLVKGAEYVVDFVRHPSHFLGLLYTLALRSMSKEKKEYMKRSIRLAEETLKGDIEELQPLSYGELPTLLAPALERVISAPQE